MVRVYAWAVALAVLLAVLASQLAAPRAPWAGQGLGALELDGAEEDEEGVEEEGEEDEVGGELAEGLGEAAWNLGAPAVLAFVAYKHAYLAAAKRGLRLPVKLAWALRAHIAASVALGLAALAHGALLLEEAGPVEWASGALIAVLLASGALLYYSKSRNLKRLARLIHAQRLLSIILLVLVAIHVASMD